MSLVLLKTGPAEDRPALGWLERNRGWLTACRTGGPGFRAHFGCPVGTLRLALLTALGVVRELFVVEEELLASREHELGAAIDALQNSIRKFHGRLPQDGETPNRL